MKEKRKDLRLAALRRFAVAITVFNVLGHTVLGFEQSWFQWLIGPLSAYAVDLILEGASSWSQNRRPVFLKGPIDFVNFLLPAHITGQAVAMLLYANNHTWPIIFASTVAIASKYMFRIPIRGRTRHFFNPSNIGIAATLLLFPWVGIAPPYHFTENISGPFDWALPAIIIVTGSFLNAKLTRRIPLILSWVAVFALQAVARSVIFNTPLVAPLLPMTGVAFVLFTFYMVSDPGTTPFRVRDQIYFGASVGLVYGLLTMVHIVFGLFFALGIVCTVRGAYHAVLALSSKESIAPVGSPVQQPASAPSGIMGKLRQ